MAKEKVGKDTNLRTNHMQNWKRNDPLLAKKLDQPVRFIKSAFGGVKPPRQLRGNAGFNFSVKKFEVVTVEEDFLLCRAAEDPETADEVKIALPPEMRKQIYDFNESGQIRTLPNDRKTSYAFLNTQKRKAFDEGDNDPPDDPEIQVIVPAYVKGDIIFAMQGIVGGTGLTEDINGVNIPIAWQDMNVSARAWAKASDQDDES